MPETPWYARALEWFIDRFAPIQEWREWPKDSGVNKPATCECDRDCSLGCDE